MNYGRRKAAKKQKKITSRKSMQNKRIGVRLFKAFLLCALVIGIAAVIGVGVYAKKIIDNAPEGTPDDVRPQGFTTFVYAFLQLFASSLWKQGMPIYIKVI